MKKYTPELWLELAETICELIITEIDDCLDSEYLHQIFPKMLICYEFFRLMRGEAFNRLRPHGLGAMQEKIYQMENKISGKLDEMVKKIDPKNPEIAHELSVLKESFDLRLNKNSKKE